MMSFSHLNGYVQVSFKKEYVQSETWKRSIKKTWKRETIGENYI